MPGVVTKMTVFTHRREILALGGWRLIVAVLLAKPGTPFLTVFTRVVR